MDSVFSDTIPSIQIKSNQIKMNDSDNDAIHESYQDEIPTLIICRRWRTKDERTILLWHNAGRRSGLK